MWIINYKTNRINNVYHTNFLGLTLDSTLPWKPHIGQLTSKLNSAWYIIRSLKSIISLENLRMIYFSSVHSIISYGTIFWDNSTYSNTIVGTPTLQLSFPWPFLSNSVQQRSLSYLSVTPVSAPSCKQAQLPNMAPQQGYSFY